MCDVRASDANRCKQRGKSRSVLAIKSASMECDRPARSLLRAGVADAPNKLVSEKFAHRDHANRQELCARRTNGATDKWFHLVERLREDMEDSTMRRRKQASKRTGRKEVVPVLGAVGVSLSLTGGASAATAGPVPDVSSTDTTSSHGIILNEEEIADVSLGTFFVFDKENSGASRFGEQYARGCGCRCGGCRGCGRGCRACRGCAGCGGCGCGGCGCGGCGCCLTWGVCRWC
jgi:hypothetical protein